MTKTRKTLFLSLGVAVGFTGLVSASERDRESAGARESKTAVSADVSTRGGDFKLISPGVGVGTVNGQQMQVRADGAITQADVEKQHGSLDRARFEATQRNVPFVVSGEGTKLYANGAMGNFADVLGPLVAEAQKQESKPLTVDDLKAQYPWIEGTHAGQTQLAFANGAVLNDPSMMVTPQAQHRNQIPSVVQNGVRIFADGATFTDDQASR